MPSDEQDKAGVVAPPPLIYVGSLIFGLLLNRRFPIPFLPRRIARSLGWPLLSGGVLLIGWFEWAMQQARTPANLYKAVSHMVTEGPFQYTRNPAYLSMTLIYTGISSLANALWAILLLPVALLVIQRGVIEREERYLQRKFGDAYRRYYPCSRKAISGSARFSESGLPVFSVLGKLASSCVAQRVLLGRWLHRTFFAGERV